MEGRSVTPEPAAFDCKSAFDTTPSMDQSSRATVLCRTVIRTGLGRLISQWQHNSKLVPSCVDKLRSSNAFRKSEGINQNHRQIDPKFFSPSCCSAIAFWIPIASMVMFARYDVHQPQEFGDHRDLVRFLAAGRLPPRQAVIAGPYADRTQRPQEDCNVSPRCLTSNMTLESRIS